MKIREIPLADVAVGKVWRARQPPKQEPYPDLVDLEIEPGVDLREEDDVVYSALAVASGETCHRFCPGQGINGGSARAMSRHARHQARASFASAPV